MVALAIASAFPAPVARMRVDLARVGGELGVPLAHRAEELDDRLGDRGLERAVARPANSASACSTVGPVATA